MVNAGRRWGTASFLCGLFCVAGCTSQASVPVAGTVTLNRKPLNDASVVFSPVRASDPGPFNGTTDSAGRFALMSPDKKVSGATPGTYRIMITTVKFDPNAPDGPPLRKEAVPVAFTNGSQRFEVPPGGTKEANFDIKNSSEK
jgi:hypothetical protein